MNYRTFGNTGWTVSEVGLGTWQIGADWGDVDDSTAEKVLETAVENGVTFFDTADCYGEGLAETRLGRFVKTLSTEVVIATKIGRFPRPGWPDNFSLKQFRKHTEDSLKRLGMETLDLAQVHCPPTDLLKRGEVFDWLRTLKQEGKIKQFGFSVESMEEAQICLHEKGVTSLQIIFNIFRQKPIESIFKQAQEKQVAIIVRLPLASGMLSGKFSRDTTFDETDHRNFNRDGEAFSVGETFSGIPFETGLDLVDALSAHKPDGWDMAQFALRWILDFDAVSTVIAGASKPEQVRSNAEAANLPPLPESLHADLARFYGERVRDTIKVPI